MRTLSLILTTIFFFTVGSLCLKAIHVPVQPRAEKQSSYEAYLELDAGFAEFEKELVAAIRKDSKAAEAYFVSIIKDGLPAEAIESAKADYARFFEYQQAFLVNKERSITVRRYQKEEAERWAAPRQSLDNFVKVKLQSFERNTRARAMEGLAVLERRSAQSFLEELAENDRFELQAYAQELLERN